MVLGLALSLPIFLCFLAAPSPMGQLRRFLFARRRHLVVVSGSTVVSAVIGSAITAASDPLTCAAVHGKVLLPPS